MRDMVLVVVFLAIAWTAIIYGGSALYRNESRIINAVSDIH